MNSIDKGIARRALIGSGFAAAGLAAIATPARAAGLASRAPGRPRTLALSEAGADAWQAAVGTSFSAETELGRVALRLAAIEPLATVGKRPKRLARDHTFAATFEVPAGTVPSANRAYLLT